jgi:hypothetical protein
MKKILLVSGCSNTEKDFISSAHPDLDTSWPKWPELLAKKLDMYCVNLAKSGMGNEYIYTTLLRYITTSNCHLGLVIPAWTQCQRKDFQKKGYWWNQRIDPDGDVFSWMRRSLDTYLNFQMLCEKYNLPYMQVQMLSPYQDWLNGLLPAENDPKYYKGFRHRYPGNEEKDNKKLIKMIGDYENLLDTKKFLGWPLSHEYAGYSLQKKLIGIRSKKTGVFKNVNLDTMISNLDHHPNAKGHEKIAEFIYERL